jgi:2-C-methyl-D-erythritol 4-phosphate cytidylyltransferase
MNAAIIVAGGTGERFEGAEGKQLARVAGSPVLAHTVLAFERCAAVDAVVVVAHPDRVDEYRRVAVEAVGARKVVAVVAGGDTRRASVASGISALPEAASVVAVHDGARAAITPETIAAAFAALSRRPDVAGVVVGHPSFDTVKQVDADGRIVLTPERRGLWIAQTPQVFRVEALAHAHARAAADGYEGTDDASLVERDGGTVLMVRGPRWNMKVTVPEDLDVLAALLAARGRAEES